MAVTLEAEFDGKRFKHASDGLRALAERFGKDFAEFGHVLGREMQAFLDEELLNLSGIHSGSVTTRNRLAKRTGDLVKALQRGAEVTHSGKLTSVEGRVYLPRQYHVHEYGGTLRPTSGKYLFVPLPAALTSNGKPKKMRPRDWRGTFIAESRKGNLLLFQRKGPRLIPLYALKPKAKIRPRLGLRQNIRRGVPAFADRALEALLDEILKP